VTNALKNFRSGYMERKQIVGIIVAVILTLLILTILVGGNPADSLNFGYGYGI